MSQPVEFWPDETQAPVTISARDAARLVSVLRQASPERATADKIERASQHGGGGHVALSIGEDEAVLRALAELRESGDFLPALRRLERDLQAKIDRES